MLKEICRCIWWSIDYCHEKWFSMWFGNLTASSSIGTRSGDGDGDGDGNSDVAYL